MTIRVLIVDDELDTLNLLKVILELSGYHAVTTLNSVDAITLAELEHPDCVLLDIMMPQLDGFTLCKMMRLHPATAHLPIVFVTAYSALDLEDRRKDAGADMVLPKPIGMDTLISTVEEAIQRRGGGKPNGTTIGASAMPHPPLGSIPPAPDVAKPSAAPSPIPEPAPVTFSTPPAPPPTPTITPPTQEMPKVASDGLPSFATPSFVPPTFPTPSTPPSEPVKATSPSSSPAAPSTPLPAAPPPTQEAAKVVSDPTPHGTAKPNDLATPIHTPKKDS